MMFHRLLAVLMLLSVCVCLFSCGTVSEPRETEHQHQYHLNDTVMGTCAVPGHQVFACTCGDSFTSTVPTPHVFDTVAASDSYSSYVKEFCTVCGVYTVTRNYEYVCDVDFENAADAKTAFEQGKSELYRVSFSKLVSAASTELVEDMGDMSLKSVDTNIYTIDKTRSVEAGEDFVVSFDVRFEEHGRTSVFSIICQQQGKNDFSYNGGLVFIEKDGKLSTVAPGLSDAYKEVSFSEQGYDTVTVKGNLATGLYDVYLNGELVRKDVPYVKVNEPQLACLRYFDAQNSEPYVALLDNIKLYNAPAPEFVMDESQFGADGHAHEAVEKIVEPTCTQAGSKSTVCSICDEQLSVTAIDAVDHVALGSATCTEDAVCKLCGTVLERKTGHTVTSFLVTKPATATEPGSKQGKCATCGKDVVEAILMGLMDTFDSFPAGQLTSTVMKEHSAFAADFTCSVKDGAFEIVAEGDNRCIEKNAKDGNFLYTDGNIDAERIEISFDLLVKSASKKIKGIVSLRGETEMRILSIEDGNSFAFGLGEPFAFAPCKIGEWISFRIIVHVATFNYEIYIDGEKVLETESDPDRAGRHLMYVYENGNRIRKDEGSGYDDELMHDPNARNPYVLHGERLTGFEFFHYSADLVCQMDDLIIAFIEK